MFVQKAFASLVSHWRILFAASALFVSWKVAENKDVAISPFSVNKNIKSSLRIILNAQAYRPIYN